MLKPFYNKKKNIDDRLVPAVSAADAGKFLGVTEDGKIGLVEGGGGNVIFISAKFTSPSTVVVEKNYEEVIALLNAGKEVYLSVKMNNAIRIFELGQYNDESIIFQNVIFSVDENNEPQKLIIINVAILLDADNTATAYSGSPQYVELRSYI